MASKLPLLTPLATLFIATLTLGGCQTASQGLQVGSSGSVDFGAAWTAYGSCRSSQDLTEVMRKAEAIGSLVGIRPTNTPISQPSQKWADQVRELFHPNKPRLSADPHTMAVDCWLHAGRVAEARGQVELAYQMYSRVLNATRTSEHNYYFEVAQSNLSKLRLDLQASATNRPALPAN